VLLAWGGGQGRGRANHARQGLIPGCRGQRPGRGDHHETNQTALLFSFKKTNKSTRVLLENYKEAKKKERAQTR
jgi:hypothetical protein